MLATQPPPVPCPCPLAGAVSGFVLSPLRASSRVDSLAKSGFRVFMLVFGGVEGVAMAQV